MSTQPTNTKTPVEQHKPDLTSVRSLVTSVTKLARHLKLTNNAVYRWINVNRIPGAHVIRVANFYDVELYDLLSLTGSDNANEVTVSLKPRSVLKALMEVFCGRMTLDQAVAETGQSLISLKLILVHWGDELPTLYTTLEQLDQGRISLEDGMRRLKVTKYTLHGIRRKYGYAPGPVKRTRPFPTIGPRKKLNREVALRCIAGKISVHDAALEHGISERTLFRTIETISPLKMMDLVAWPDAFREALAAEIEQKLPFFSQKWLGFAVNARFYMQKKPNYPETPISWRNLPIRRLLVGTLLGEGSPDDIAASRGADPVVLAGIFTGELRAIGTSFEEVVSLPMIHQVAMAELLIASMDRKRKLK